MLDPITALLAKDRASGLACSALPDAPLVKDERPARRLRLSQLAARGRRTSRG
jgi:hypothetical protein